jgi:hypothetical protein
LPNIHQIELKEVLSQCSHKFAVSLNTNEFLNLFAVSLDSIDTLAKCEVIEIFQIFAPYCTDRNDIFHKIFDIFINSKMSYERRVTKRALKSLHTINKNFAKTMLKNMHSYLHSPNHFKRVVSL